MFTYETYKLELKSSVVKVQEGLCVLVPCTFFELSGNRSSDKVFGYWFRAGANTDHDSPVATNNLNQLVKNLSGDPRNNDCSLDIRDVQRTDSGSYFFRIEKDSFEWNYYKNQLSVQVTGKVLAPRWPERKLVGVTEQLEDPGLRVTGDGGE